MRDEAQLGGKHGALRGHINRGEYGRAIRHDELGRCNSGACLLGPHFAAWLCLGAER